MPEPARIPPRERIGARMAQLLISPEEPLLVGFSGGPDSVALTLWLLECGYTRLTLVHLDHALRADSAEEGAWVRSFAQTHGLAVHCARTDVAHLARATRTGVEEAGRNARHLLYGQVASERQVSHVVLGHQADDQVETLLFRLLRGSGSGGLGGMALCGARHHAGFAYNLLRPMLDVWREEVLDFLKTRGAAFLEDPSNADPRWVRNRIRHGVLPALDQALGRPVRATLLRTAEHLRAEDACLQEMAACLGTGPSLAVKELRALHPALQRRVVWSWLRRHGVADCGQAEVRRVLGLLESLRPAQVNLPGSAHARRRKGWIHLVRPGAPE